MRIGMLGPVSIQIAVRLPDHLVAELDRIVASGAATNRTEVVTSALERELRRRIQERDLQVMAQAGEDDELVALARWGSGHPLDLG